MSNLQNTGTSLQLVSVEESAPYELWLSWLKNVAINCITHLHLPQKTGYKHSAVIFWKVIILSALMALSLNEAANRLNKALWKEYNSSLRRKKIPKQYKGAPQRFERLCPNGDQVRKYRNSLPNYVVRALNQIIFDAQLKYAKEQKLIGQKLTLLVDNTQEWYYGKDRYPQNQFINGGHNGPGTNHKRNYLGMMIKSGKTFLYAGVDMIKKGASNVPTIMANIDRLIQDGFIIEKVLADRWFPTYEFLSELNVRNIPYIGPYKKYAPIKRIIEQYLKDGKEYIIPYQIKGAPAKYYHLPTQQVWLILTNRRGRRLRDIRKDYLDGTLTLADSMKEIFVIVTTLVPPRGKKARQGWAVKVCHAYDSRWNIETGFRDANRIGWITNARTNTRRLFMFTLRFWVFNLWHIERAKSHRRKGTPKSWKKGPTLRDFGYQIAVLEKCY